MNKKTGYIPLLTLIIVQMILVFVSNRFILTDTLYYGSLSQSLSNSQIDTLLQYQNKYSWVSYVLLLLIIPLKLVIVAFILYAGCILSGFKVKFRGLFDIATYGAYVSVISMLITIIWFGFVRRTYTLEDIQYFAPLSLLNLFDPASIDPIWIYPLQTANVFEVAYWFALAYGIWRLTKTSFETSFFLVVKSYLPTLIAWIAFVMFLTVTLSPA